MQIKNSFDKETKQKILKSLGLTVLSGVAAFLTSLSTGSDPKSAALIGASTMVTFIVNTVKEYTAGEPASKQTDD